MSQWRLRTSLLVIAVVCAVMAPIPTSRPASATPELLAQTSPTSSGYWMLEKDGTVYNFGGSQHFGNADWTASAVALVPTVTAGGYWIVSKFGGVAAYGDAPTFESAYAEIPDGETVTTAATTPSGQGLWLFTDSGRVIVRGDARQFGDLTHLTLDGPIVGSSATPTGGGYLMVGGDGGVFAFGDAVFRGSIPGILPPGTRLDKPVVGVSTSPSNLGYWMVASDGGIFAFGDSAFRGSIPGVLPGVTLNQPVNGMVPYGNGYLMVASDGGIFNFSDLEFLGSLGANPPDTAIVGVAPMPHVPVLPAATWVNSDTTSSLLWVTEFEPNAAGARRVAWYGTRTGNTFAPSRGELFVDSDVPVVIHLTNDGSGLQSIVGPDGTKATVVRYLTDSQVIVMVEEPGGGQRSELVDLRSVPASPPPPSPVGARSVSSPPEARAALPRDLPDRWPLLARPAVLDLDLQKVPVDADIDVSLTRTTTRCSSVGNDDLMCATNYDPATGRLQILPALWIDVPDTAEFLTRGECDLYNDWLFVESVLIGALLTIVMPLAWLPAIALGATTGVFWKTVASGDCTNVDAVVDVGTQGIAQTEWRELTRQGAVVLEASICMSARGLLYEPDCVDVSHNVDSLNIETGASLGTRQILVAKHTPLALRSALTASTVEVGEGETGIQAWVKGGYPLALNGDHTYEVTVDWDDGSKTSTTRTYTDETEETAFLDPFVGHSYDRAGTYTVIVLAQNGDEFDINAHTVTVVAPPTSGDVTIFRVEQLQWLGDGATCAGLPDPYPYTAEHTIEYIMDTDGWYAKALDHSATMNAQLNKWASAWCAWGYSTVKFHSVSLIARNVERDWAETEFTELRNQLEPQGYAFWVGRFNGWFLTTELADQRGSVSPDTVLNNLA